jgi:hypothetical protein
MQAFSEAEQQKNAEDAFRVVMFFRILLLPVQAREEVLTLTLTPEALLSILKAHYPDVTTEQLISEAQAFMRLMSEYEARKIGVTTEQLIAEAQAFMRL